MHAAPVTVGITCFNAADTIERCIRSAQAQTWPALEILVVDDASSDGSVEIVERLAAADDRIRLIRHEANRGAGAARTTLVNAARGEFLAFLDDDDEALPERVVVQLEALTAMEAAGLPLVACYGSRTVVTPDGRRSYSGSIGRDGQPLRGEEVAYAILTGMHLPGQRMGRHGSCTLLARLDTFRQVGPFDPQFRRHQDTDWAIRLALMGGTFIGTKDPVLLQHITPTSDKNAELVLELALALRRKYRAYLGRRRSYYAAIAKCHVEHYNVHGPKMRFWLALLALLLFRPDAVIGPWRYAKRKQFREWRKRLSAMRR